MIVPPIVFMRTQLVFDIVIAIPRCSTGLYWCNGRNNRTHLDTDHNHASMVG